jgi:hypothetical protein
MHAPRLLYVEPVVCTTTASAKARPAARSHSNKAINSLIGALTLPPSCVHGIDARACSKLRDAIILRARPDAVEPPTPYANSKLGEALYRGLEAMSVRL